MGHRNEPSAHSRVDSPANGPAHGERSESDAVGTNTIAVLIPVKSFDVAKGRLADRLDPGQRSSLAVTMASRVVEAARPLPTFIICDDDNVAAWAKEIRAEVIWSPVAGLNPAVTFGRDTIRTDFDRIIIAHADLPLATDLSWVADFHGVTIVQDRHGGGTNVLSVPTGPDFQFRYGEGSSLLHQSEAARLGLPVNVVDHDELGWDVDTGQDFDMLPPKALKELSINQLDDRAQESESE